MSKKILITGSGGFVGKNLCQLLKTDFNIMGIDRNVNEFVDKIVDISDVDLLTNVLNQFNPDEIIHLAALSNVEQCEAAPELARRCNILPTETLVAWADKNNKRVIFISSDYVFDGGKGNFNEDDQENPIQYYGKTKLEDERLVSTLKNYVILRPTVIYGWDPGGMNFFMQLFRNKQTGKKIKVATDQISNPTFVLDLCALIGKVLHSNLSGKYITTGNVALSRYDFSLKICEYMGWNSDFIIPVKTSLLGQIAKRPLNNSTCNDRVVENFGGIFGDLEKNLDMIKLQIDRVI